MKITDGVELKDRHTKRQQVEVNQVKDADGERLGQQPEKKG